MPANLRLFVKCNYSTAIRAQIRSGSHIEPGRSGACETWNGCDYCIARDGGLVRQAYFSVTLYFLRH